MYEYFSVVEVIGVLENLNTHTRDLVYTCRTTRNKIKAGVEIDRLVKQAKGGFGGLCLDCVNGCGRNDKSECRILHQGSEWIR